MSDQIDFLDVQAFKTNLQTKRKEKGFTQESFTEALNYTNRSKIATWESVTAQTLPNLEDFYSICKVLDCDPNCMLGFSNLECTNDGVAAEYTNLSVKTVERLREVRFAGMLTDALITSPKSSTLIHKIFQLCNSGFHSVVPEGIFSLEALLRLEKAFEEFRSNTFSLDMCAERFEIYVAKAFPWDKNNMTFKELLESIIIDERYYDMVFNSEHFKHQSDDERYYSLMSDVASASYKYLISPINNKIVENEISQLLNEIIKDFIKDTVREFKQGYEK